MGLLLSAQFLLGISTMAYNQSDQQTDPKHNQATPMLQYSTVFPFVSRFSHLEDLSSSLTRAVTLNKVKNQTKNPPPPRNERGESCCTGFATEDQRSISIYNIPFVLCCERNTIEANSIMKLVCTRTLSVTATRTSQNRIQMDKLELLEKRA